MPTWLDRYAFPLVEIFGKESGLDFEVPDAMKQMTTAALQKMGPSPSLDSPWRFEADLRPHFDQAFRNVRSALRLSPGMSLPLIDRIASDGDLARYQEHTDRWNYTFIDCPEGSFPIGGGVEVQAVFVKKGRVIGIEEVRSVPAPEGLAYEVVIGRTGRFSRQHIRWNTDLTKSLGNQEEKGEDPDLFETMPLGDLIAVSGRSARQIGQCVLNVVIGATSHAALHRGTSMAVPLRKVPAGDRALRGAEPHPSKTIVDCIVLRGIEEVTAPDPG